MIICHFDDTNSIGGLEKQARKLANTLLAQGEDVVMLSSTRKLTRAGWSNKEGLPLRLFWTYSSPQVSGRYLPASLIWALQLLIWVFAHRSKISVIHCHQIRIHAFVAAIASKLWKIPCILKSGVGGEGADIRAIGTRKYFGAAGRRFVIRNSDSFVATTQSLRADLIRWNVPSEKIQVVPNGIEIGDTGSPGMSDDLRARRCLFLGRLSPDKNVLGLAEAAADVCDDQGLVVHFYGQGQNQAQLDRLLQKRQNGCVAYMGWTKDVGSILNNYGYLLLPSNAEGLSNAMIEAMVHGVVPVTTKVTGCIDHIRPGETGFFFDDVDHDSLVRRLRTLAAIPSDEWRAMSENVQQQSRSAFDMRSVSRAYIELYDNLAKSRPLLAQPVR